MKGYILAGTAALLWGLISIFGKVLVNYPGNNPVALMFIRAALAFVTLGVGLLIFRPRELRIIWRDVPFFLAFGLLAIAGSYCLYIFALKYVSVTTAVVIMYSYPVQVAVLATLFMNERLNAGKVVALVMALTGCFFVAEAYNLERFQVNLTGILFSLGASISVTIYNLGSKRMVGRYSPWTFTLYGFGFGALWMLIISSPQAVLSVRLPLEGWISLVAWAWFPTVLGYVLYTTALKYIEISAAAILGTLEPVASIAMACVFLGETIRGWQLLGAFLVIAAVGVLGRSARVQHRAVLIEKEPSRA